ncbi:MAG TPA: sigma-70 family RNA polymerase sigma factor [Bacteroidetes bacterium]|nr:sigma-70 family RNA polymerase sigma factor [Bacteroidota bacterium]
MIKKYTIDESEIISIFNDGMLRVFTQLDSYEGRGNFDGWVKIIVKNSLSNYFRKYNSKISVSEILENTHRSRSNILSKIYYDDLMKVLKILPARSSEVFRLYAIEGYSHKEISEKLGITVGTSKWHLFKAKEKLSNIIELNHENYE